MIFSVIEIETFKRCRRKWDFQSDNRQNLESRRLAAPLVVGSAVHETLAAKTDNPDASITQVYAEKAEAALDKATESHDDVDDATPIFKGIAVGLKMMEAYDKFYPTPLPSHYKPIRTEQRMVVAIPNTEHWECNNHHCFNYDAAFPADRSCPYCGLVLTWQPHYLRGTVDTLVQDERNGLIYVLERKTYGNRPKVEKLQDDTQMIAYEWILSMLFGFENVGGTLYDGIWKRDYTSEYFRKKYKLSDLFFRHLFIHPREQLEEYAYFLPAIVNEMATCTAAELYYNRRWEGCYDCGMKELCDAISRGEEYEYIRDEYYTQRRDASRFLDPEPDA